MSSSTALRIWQVDAFSSEVFGGNPAAVVAMRETWPSDALLQAIAAENNLSETAFFLLDGSEAVPLRWFTPRMEVPLCGHATLATAAVLHQKLGLYSSGSVIEMTTASGQLFVRVNDSDYTLDFPSRSITSSKMLRSTLEEVLKAPILDVWESVDRYVCMVADADTVQALVPDLAAASTLPLPGLLVTAPGNDCDFVSRYFAPAKGVPEDPVTGTSHCTLAPFWAERLGKSSLVARQLSERGGRIACSVSNGRVHLAGEARFYLEGLISVPI